MLSICSQYTLHTTFRLFGNLLNILNIIKTFKGLPNPKNTKSLAETFWVVFKSRLPVYTHSKNHNAPAVFLKPYSAHLSLLALAFASRSKVAWLDIFVEIPLELELSIINI